MTSSHDIIARLRQIRRNQSMTQTKLAEITGYSRDCLSDMECLRNATAFDTIVNVAEALGYKIELRKFAER